MTGSTLVAREEGVYAFHGGLTFATAGLLLEDMERMLEQAKMKSLVFDLAEVKTSDSAGLALLLEGVQIAARYGRVINYRNLPEDLLNLARISNAEELLPC